MKASDIAKLAAGIAAGSLIYDEVISDLDHGEKSLLDRCIAGGAAAIGGSVIGGLMDATGVSEMVDDIFDW